MINDDQKEKKFELIKNQVSVLMKSFDTIIVFATKHDDEVGNTTMFNYGEGNYFARYGQIREWINREEGKIFRGE